MQSISGVSAASPSSREKVWPPQVNQRRCAQMTRCGILISPLVGLLLGTFASAQSYPSREYIYLGSRVVAIEAPFAISPTSSNPSAASTPGQFQLTTSVASATNWTAASTVSWITFTVNGQTLSSMTGTVSASAPATITYQVAPNTLSGSRTGTITVTVPTATATPYMTMTYTVTQSGAGSAGFSISPTSNGFGAASGTGSFQVSSTSSTSVTWSASSNATWVIVPIASGPVMTGAPATINYQVTQNLSTSSRTTTITVKDPNLNPFTFTVNQAGAPPPNVPSVVSISPLAQSGVGQIFTATYTDTAGPTSISEAQILIRPFTDNGLYGGTCYASWRKGAGAGTFSLMDDNGAIWLPVASGSTVSNKQCTLSASGSTATTAGNNLVVNFNISVFTQSFSYGTPLSVYLQAKDSTTGVVSTGLVLETTYLVAQPGYPGLTVNMTPSGSTATELPFNVTAVPSRSWDDVLMLTVLINNLITGNPPSNNPNAALTEDEGACGFWFYPGTTPPNFVLFGDGGIPSGIAGTGSFGQAAAIANSQCSLNLTSAKSPVISNTLQNVNFLLDITANPNFKGPEQVSIQGYLLPVCNPCFPAGWEPLKVAGLWTPYPLVSTSAPPAASQTVSPASGIGLSPVLTFTAYSANSYGYISKLDVWINSTPGGTGGCQLLIDALSGNAAFLNDDGSASAASLGQAVTLSNSKCSINMANVKLVNSGNNRVLTLPVVFTQAFTGVQNDYFRVTEKSGNTTGWVQAGAWTVQQVSGTPSLGTVSPTSGTGLNQAFTVSASDTAGAADLASAQLVVNNSTSLASACAVTYVAAQNVFQLLNDAGSASAGAVAPGQAASVTNSQCTLSGTGSSMQVVGTTLTLVANLYFNPTFASSGGVTKTVYTSATTTAGITVTGGLTPMGTWTVPSQAPTPTISALSPPAAAVGGLAFTLTVNGTNFVSGAVVKWSGAALQTAFVSPTQLTAPIAANLIASVGTASLVVVNPGNLSSATAQFPIQALPTITSLSPPSATAGGGAFTLTVNGANYLTGATVKWNGSALTTTFVSAAKLTATVPANLIASAGSASITAVNASGLSSTAATFNISAPVPVITSLYPSVVTHGGPGGGLFVYGTGFLPSSVVKWNGAVLPTGYSSSTLLIGTVSASQITVPGSAQITVYTAGGGTSNALTLTIQ